MWQVNERKIREDVMSQESIEKMIHAETKKRLRIMEEPAYEFPEKAGRWDVLGIVTAIGVSVVLIILCMMGVIV